MTIQQKINDLKQQIDVHEKHLSHLELQKAKFGSLYLPPYVAIEIEEKKNEIRRLTKELQGLEQEISISPPFERLKPEIQGEKHIPRWRGLGGGNKRLKPEIQIEGDVQATPPSPVPPATTTTKTVPTLDTNLPGETEIIPLTNIARTPKQAKFDSKTDSYFGLEIDYDYMNPIFPALFQTYINLKVPGIKIKLKNSSDAPFTNIILSYKMHNIIDEQTESIIDILNPQESISKEVMMIVPDPNTLFQYERRPLNLSLKIKFKNQFNKEYEWAKVLQLSIASKNSFIWQTTKGEDCSELIAVFITPHDPAIKTFLGKAREFSPNREFFGYQKNRENVLQQIKAIYETLKAEGVSYVSTTLDFSGHQSIKLPSQTLTDGYGNCADSSVLFAAICEAIKINPIIIVIPKKHMFFGFEAFRGEGEYFLLETTYVGNHTFEEAIKKGREIFKINRGNLKIIDITRARDAGIFPIML